ncbi:MAG TPA: hypothetical protein VHC19_28055, partial [Pirellulales bacterium]|nr:hypothetical protein [Pirellulales bacterium]
MMRAWMMAATVVMMFSEAQADEPRTGGQAAGLSQQEIDEGFVSLFNGRNLDGWQGATGTYAAEDGKLVCKK